jgi:hypothetical protein
VLDGAAAIHASVLRIAGHPLLDLKHATLSVTHPRPGQQIKITVPLVNNGPGTIRVRGVLVAHAAGKAVARTAIRSVLGPYAHSAVSLRLKAGSVAITLTSAGLHTSHSKELGLPLPASQLVASAGSDQTVTLRWTPASDHDITGYRIYRSLGKSYELIGLSTNPDYVDVSTGADTHTTYAVSAVDKQGRESFLSRPATVLGSVKSVHL